MTKKKRGSTARQFAERAADKMIEQLRKGVAPWQKGWDKPQGSELPAYNPVTGTRYRGLNSFVLACMAVDLGYADPRWTTYRGAKKINAQVRKGERGVVVEYWKFPTPEQEARHAAAVSNGDKSDKLHIIHRTYTVFNAEQIEGMPTLESVLSKQQDWAACVRAEAFAAGVRCEDRASRRKPRFLPVFARPDRSSQQGAVPLTGSLLLHRDSRARTLDRPRQPPGSLRADEGQVRIGRVRQGRAAGGNDFRDRQRHAAAAARSQLPRGVCQPLDQSA